LIGKMRMVIKISSKELLSKVNIVISMILKLLINVKFMNVLSNVKTWSELKFVKKPNNYGVYVHMLPILALDNGLVPMLKLTLFKLLWN
jgi:hypothetical protein